MPVDMMYGIVRSGQNDELMHYGRSKRDGAPKGSGRYPLGSKLRKIIDVDDYETVTDESYERTVNADKNLSNYDDLAKTTEAVGKNTAKIAQFVRSAPKKQVQPPDLSKMTDQELQAYVRRYSLESQYKKYYSEVQGQSNIEKGRKRVADTLDYIGAGLGITASALGILVAIKKLRGD